MDEKILGGELNRALLSLGQASSGGWGQDAP